MSTATGRRITTEEATVKTATVEIKALTIGGKQVTLAVFRQLIEEDIIDGFEARLCGVPWGTINYHSGVGCDDFKGDKHLHVVWQKGNELRRSCVRASQDGRTRELQHTLNALMTSSLAKQTLDEGYIPQEVVKYRYQGIPYRLLIGREVADIALRKFDGIWFNASANGWLTDTAKRKALLDILLESNADEETSWQSLRADALTAAGTLSLWKQERAALYHALEALDQLFIAV